MKWTIESHPRAIRQITKLEAAYRANPKRHIEALADFQQLSSYISLRSIPVIRVTPLPALCSPVWYFDPSIGQFPFAPAAGTRLKGAL